MHWQYVVPRMSKKCIPLNASGRTSQFCARRLQRVRSVVDSIERRERPEARLQTRLPQLRPRRRRRSRVSGTGLTKLHVRLSPCDTAIDATRQQQHTADPRQRCTSDNDLPYPKTRRVTRPNLARRCAPSALLPTLPPLLSTPRDDDRDYGLG